MTALAQQIQTAIKEQKETFFERAPVIEVLWLAILARMNPFLLSPPGAAKSMLVRDTCSRIIDTPNGGEAAYWETLFHKFLTVDDMFGPIDMVAFDKQNVWHRKVEGYLPTAILGFGDEIWKSSEAVVNVLLAITNEHIVHVNSQPMDVPLLAFATASNEMPDLSTAVGALWDRMQFRVVLDYVQDEANFDKLLQLAAGDIAPLDKSKRTNIELTDLTKAVYEEVPAITVSSDMRDAVRTLKNTLAHPPAGDDSPAIKVSDRKWVQVIQALKANAYLNGRTAVDDDDLQVMRWMLWETPELIGPVERKVLQLASPQTAIAVQLIDECEQIMAGVNSLKGQATGKKAQHGAEWNNNLRRMFKELAKSEQEARAAGRSVTKLTEARERMTDTRKAVLVECLNVPAAAADRAGDYDDDGGDA